MHVPTVGSPTSRGGRALAFTIIGVTAGDTRSFLWLLRDLRRIGFGASGFSELAYVMLGSRGLWLIPMVTSKSPKT